VAYSENFHGGVIYSVAYSDHLYLVCAICDVTIWRHINISKPTFWRSWNNMRILPHALSLFYVFFHWIWTISAAN